MRKKFIPTKIIERPMLVQEIGGERTWEAYSTDPFENMWRETTGGKYHHGIWCRVDGAMIRAEEAARL